MIRFEVPYDNVRMDYTEKAFEFIELLRMSSSKCANMDIDDILWEYSCGFFNKEPKSEEDFLDFDIRENDKLSYGFPERLEYELEKFRVHLVMTAGDFTISDKLIGIPEDTISVAVEVVKIMMFEEQKDIKDKEVIDSIPPIRLDVPDIILDDMHDERIILEDKYPLSVDGILDKINKYGIESLSRDEYKFLDSQSE